MGTDADAYGSANELATLESSGLEDLSAGPQLGGDVKDNTRAAYAQRGLSWTPDSDITASEVNSAVEANLAAREMGTAPSVVTGDVSVADPERMAEAAGPRGSYGFVPDESLHEVEPAAEAQQEARAEARVEASERAQKSFPRGASESQPQYVFLKNNKNSVTSSMAAGTAGALPTPAGGGGGFLEGALKVLAGAAARTFPYVLLPSLLTGDSPQPYLSNNNSKQIGGVTVRKDVVLPGGGRGGEKVKNLTGPPNSAVRGAGGNRVYVTDSQGRVIKDITRDRVKPVTPGKGFGKKEFKLTQDEMDLLKEFGY
ncbi:hypothetical protein Dalu01_02389 [Deinococcus aluminii]|uniref:Uncharacterized protein n=2 Tax=Deinococcus aluminii TaxID=1656885 RepID=A0ABP9XHH1_9DEIO